MSQIEQMIYRISTTSRTLHIAQIHWHNWYYLSEYMIRYGLLKGRAFMSINVKEYRRVNHIWTIQRNWQHLEHKTKTNKVKIQHIYVGHSYPQRNTNNVNKKLSLLQTSGRNKWHICVFVFTKMIANKYHTTKTH